MLPVQLPVSLGLILALGAGSAAWTARLDGKDGSKISGTAQVESTPAMPPSDSATPPKDSMPATTPAAPAELRVTITLSNAPANSSLSWYLYSGSCNDANAGAAESILGVPSTYNPVKVDGSAAYVAAQQLTMTMNQVRKQQATAMHRTMLRCPRTSRSRSEFRGAPPMACGASPAIPAPTSTITPSA